MIKMEWAVLINTVDDTNHPLCGPATLGLGLQGWWNKWAYFSVGFDFQMARNVSCSFILAPQLNNAFFL
jgi:hypothetical protein